MRGFFSWLLKLLNSFFSWLVNLINESGGTLRSLTPPRSTEFLSCLWSIGWVQSLSGNPNFLIGSNYLSPVDHLTGGATTLRAFFGVLFIIQATSLLLTRNDQSDALYQAGESSPDKVANRRWVYIPRVLGFLLAFFVWFWMFIVTNLTLLITARTTSTSMYLNILLFSLSAYYAVKISIWFVSAKIVKKKRLEVQESHEIAIA